MRTSQRTAREKRAPNTQLSIWFRRSMSIPTSAPLLSHLAYAYVPLCGLGRKLAFRGRQLLFTAMICVFFTLFSAFAAARFIS